MLRATAPGQAGIDDRRRLRLQREQDPVGHTAAVPPDGLQHSPIGHVLRLQRAVGNRTAARYVASRMAGTSGGNIQRWTPGKIRGRARNLKNVSGPQGAPQVDEEGPATLVEGVGSGFETGAELPNAAALHLGDFGGEHSRLHDNDDDEPITFTGEGHRGAMGIASSAGWALGSGLGAGAGAIGLGMNFMKLVQTIKKHEAGYGWDVGSISLELMGNLNTTLTGGASAAAYGTAAIGAEFSSTTSDYATGIGDSIGGIGGMVDVFLGLAKGTMGTIKYFADVSKKGWGQGEALLSVGMEFLKALKGFLSSARLLMGAVSTFLEMADVAAQFVQTVPLVGAAINILIQLLDALMTTIEFVVKIYKVVKAALNVQKLKQLGGGIQGTGSLVKNMVEVNRKRWRRQVVPMIADGISLFANVISISGSVLNIVGVATAAAYGAGVGVMAAGYALSATSTGMKLGAAGLKQGQKLVRWSKQKIRNAGKGGTTGKNGAGNRMYRLGKMVGIDMDKTTTAKTQALAGDIAALLHLLASLPVVPDKTADPNGFSAAEVQYKSAYYLVKSTGVSIKELLSAQPNEVVKILADAMRQRD